ncbi:MAG: hypothetical protein P4L40_25310 [Terracidiphilus sp.]|nr:hypothetical protein [Terracidiphilus sp.]
MTTPKTRTAIVLGAALVCAAALGWSQSSDQSQKTGVKQDVKAAGHDVKQGTVKAAHATAHGTKKAWDKTKSTTEGAAHGAKEGAEKKTN